ncbi:MAG: tetratricopeptide repeat protein [Deltaproteobacteria bacterium]|nr:tetratricopeptide repeat protein [Deltaproteobacteria bacterium]
MLVNMNTFQTRFNEAIRLKKAKEFEAAWQRFSELAERHPSNAYFWSNFAHLALVMNRLSAAREFIERALSLDPHVHFSRSLYADILLRQQDFHSALEIIRELMEIHPEMILVRKLVKTAERMKCLPELENLFREWLVQYPDNGELQSLAAEYFHKIGQTDTAIQLYEKIVQGNKADDFAYERFIALKTQGKSIEDKIRELETIVKLPTHQKNIYLLGLLAQEYKKAQMWEKAEETYRRLMQFTPGNLFYKKQMGFLYAKRGNPEHAIVLLEDCLLQDPDDTYVRSALFSAYQKLNAKEQALATIDKILLRYPDKKSYFGMRKKVQKWDWKNHDPKPN